MKTQGHYAGYMLNQLYTCLNNYAFSGFLLLIIIMQVPDSAILDCPSTTDFTGKDFLNPADDKTVYYEPDKQ